MVGAVRVKERTGELIPVIQYLGIFSYGWYVLAKVYLATSVSVKP